MAAPMTDPLTALVAAGAELIRADVRLAGEQWTIVRKETQQ
jgi:hypothetical protein